jgi:hypothetical protein
MERFGARTGQFRGFDGFRAAPTAAATPRGAARESR